MSRKKSKAEIGLNLTRFLRNAKVVSIPFDTIDVNDHTYLVRVSVDEAFDAADVVLERGTFDASGQHPIVLIAREKAYAIVSGHRRVAVLRSLESVSRIKCLVLPRNATLEATTVSCRLNIPHGKELTKPERKVCFLRDYNAVAKSGNKQPSFRAWAGLYGVSHGLPQLWLRGKNAGHSSQETPPDSVQSGQPGNMTASSPQSMNDVDEGAVPSTCASGGAENTQPKTAVEPNADRAVAEFQAASACFLEAVSADQIQEAHRDVLNGIIRDLQDLAFNSLDAKEVAA